MEPSTSERNFTPTSMRCRRRRWRRQPGVAELSQIVAGVAPGPAVVVNDQLVVVSALPTVSLAPMVAVVGRADLERARSG